MFRLLAKPQPRRRFDAFARGISIHLK